MKDIFRGIAHGFGPSGGVPSDVIPRGQGLEVRGDDDRIPSVTLPYIGLTVSLTGMDDAYIMFQGTWDGKTVKVLVSDKSITDQIAALGAPRAFLDALAAVNAKRAKRSMGRAAVFAALLGIVAALAVGVWLALGYGANKAVELIPPEWEITLGKSAAEQVLAENKVCSDPEIARAMNEMAGRLVGALGKHNYSFRLRVIDTDDVNAFALPGGYMFVNRGLIEQADDSFEIAGVLAHEIQHVMLRHGMHNIARQAGTMLLLRAFLGDFGGVEQFLLYNAASLASMSFSRDQERAADQGGLELMIKAGMDPRGLSRFLQKLAAEEGAMDGALSLLSTHPASTDRVEELNSAVSKKPPGEIVPLKMDIKNIQLNCSPVSLTDPDADM